jgi:hypothetical protein
VTYLYLQYSRAYQVPQTDIDDMEIDLFFDMIIVSEKERNPEQFKKQKGMYIDEIMGF